MGNKGTVTDTDVLMDMSVLKKYIGGRTALVAQGGGQRGIFTSGVLDAFLINNFDPFTSFYGTSAGALNLCAFLCRQRGIGRSFILDLTTDPKFFHLFRFIRRKQFLDLDWALDKISRPPYLLDIETGRHVLGNRNAYAAVTDTHRLMDHYLPMFDHDWRQVLVATCAIPRLYHQPIRFPHGEYVDGGVSATIPVQEAWRKEARCIIVIRTEGEDISGNDNETEQANFSNWQTTMLNTLHERWQDKLERLKNDWAQFFSEQLVRVTQESEVKDQRDALSGGRWLFGADDVYRLSHLLGDKFDSGLADMLAVHYQTYSLTQSFLQSPPDDCFIIQIKPSRLLRSSSLLSHKDELLSDYELGLEAGQRFVDSFSKCHFERAIEENK